MKVIITVLLLASGAILDARCGACEVTGASQRDLLAFVPRNGHEASPKMCTLLSKMVRCMGAQPVGTPYADLLLCSCAKAKRGPLQSEVKRFTEAFSLLRLKVTQAQSSWIVQTPDLKLLSSNSDQREALIKQLDESGFELSRADTGSPYRVVVRRRDGLLPSTQDVARFGALGVVVEPETVVITPARMELRQ